ncbi:MOSC N-terminal beta barrel domain-containing protein [Aspergillus ambiguus]|uniref:MOSC domain-containing protein n=1 Tax=Aspergillus ambiguus TaxID=176160 RepID=UPI003CCD49CF
MPDQTTLSIAVLLLLLLIPIFLFSRFAGWAQINRSSLLQRLGRRSPASSEVVALRVYPIKSCRGFQVPQTKLRMQGLDLDRRWMLVDATTNEFLTIRQIPEMTLINTALSADGASLLISVTGAPAHKTVSIPAHPDPAWLAAHTTLAQVKVWDTVTDGHVYGAAVNALFSEFLRRDVALVYKGPTPRIMQGNGDPRLLGREQSVCFSDVHPVLIASEASIAELNSRLAKTGADPITIERFRPNIIIKGDAPWSEDSWKLVRISGDAGTRQLDLDVVARCTRCQVPNVDPDTAEKHKTQPWDTLMNYRRIDEGMKYKPCFGMLSAPRNEGLIEVGMKFEVLEETSMHRYIKGF